TYIEYKPALGGFNVCEFGKETNDYNSSNPALCYRYNHIVHFVLEGEGVFVRDGKTYRLKAGQAFVITPQNLIRYYTEEGCSWTYCWLAFSGTDTEKIFSQCGFSNKVSVFDFVSEDIQPLTQYLSIIKDNQPENENAFALEVFSMAFKVLSNCAKKLNTEQVSPRTVSSSIIDTALMYMKTNLHHPITISSLCKELCISRTYFSTLFEQTMKVAPYTYLQDLRIKRASELLLSNKNLRVCEIAEMVGFSSTAQFCKTFKRVAGTSPTNFIKNYEK
ncbi:MAG: AraC family transcriptional regulator, partial [Clostridia bacterium]|nr:AraC family transcriptional regulator [Clostridia bacterium]